MIKSPILLLASLLALGIVVAGIVSNATTVDTTAPTISGITVSVTETSATISWTTDELATSNIVFSQCAHTMGCISGVMDTNVYKTSHSVNLSDLSPGTTTDFHVESEDADGNIATSCYLAFTTSNLPGTGNISGRLIYTDGKSAGGECVYIFKQGETSSYDSVSAYHDGYYIFRNVPEGQYEIYTTASYCPFTGFTGYPGTVVTVFEDEETQAETLTQIRRLWISMGEPERDMHWIMLCGCIEDAGVIVEGPKVGISHCGCVEEADVVGEPKPAFYWEEIIGAAYYTVEIWSRYTEEYSQNKEYDETVMTTTAEIVWPTDLSTLIYNKFQLYVNAYTADGLLIASNYLLFCVDRFDGD